MNHFYEQICIFMCVRFIQFPDYFESILQLVLERNDYCSENLPLLYIFIFSHNENLISRKNPRKLYQTRSVATFSPLLFTPREITRTLSKRILYTVHFFLSYMIKILFYFTKYEDTIT